MTFPNPLLIQKVNSHLRGDPVRLTSDPYGSGWLFSGWELPGQTRGGVDFGTPCGGVADGRRSAHGSGNSRIAGAEMRRGTAGSWRWSAVVADAARVCSAAFFLESELGDKGLVVSRHLLVFGFGFAVALVVGWVGFPRALYVQREQPLDFFHKTHAEKSGLSAVRQLSPDGQRRPIQRNPAHGSVRRLSHR